jgi:hypothetical protein
MPKTTDGTSDVRTESLPLGYLRQKDGQRYRVAFDPERAPVIRKLFIKVAEGKWTVYWAYLWLKYETDFSTRKGVFLSERGMRMILRNRRYCQIGTTNGEPLITKEVFKKASSIASLPRLSQIIIRRPTTSRRTPRG